MHKARFISLEVIDGAGKSTHLAPMAQWIRAQGHDLVVTREPGGTALGEALREMVLHQPMNADSEALLMFAARREHVTTVIAPALQRGAWVLSDRFADASFAYQGGGRGVALAHLQQLELWVLADLQPDLTFLFDLDPATAHQRVVQGSPVLDRFEQERGEFFTRVREAYLARAQAEPQRFHVLDALRTPEVIFAEIKSVLLARFS